MPVRLLTDAERGRFSGFPREVPEEDLFAFFTLTGPDRSAVPSRSAPANRLGFALSLCAVRYLGFCPEDLSSVPKNAAYFVGQQLMVPAEALSRYPEREQTRSDHLRRVYEHLGYRRLETDHAREVFGWLVERALEHDDAPLLVSLLAERLKRERFVRPGVSRLERMVAAARERAGEETFRALSPLLREGRTTALDALLVPDAGLPGPPNRTRHSWLKEGATSNTPRAILGQLEKLSYLRALGADELDLSALNPNRVKFLAALGRRHTNQALQRLAPGRRYPVLLAFLAASHAEITDEAIELFDRLLAQTDARSRRDLDEFRKGASKAVGEKVRLFREVGEIVLDTGVPDPEVRAAVLRRVGSAERLGELVEESERLARPLEDNYYGFFADHYARLRRFAPTFLEAFSFRSGKQGEALLRAVGLLKELDASGKRRVPGDAPLSFVPARWEPHVLVGPGRVDRRHWEACLLWELRGALRSGDVWVEGSRRYADPQKYLIPEDRWPSVKDEVRLQTGTSPEGAEQLAERKRELGRVLGRLKAAVSRGGSIQVQAGRLVFSRDRSEGLPESVLALQREIGERLPKVELTDLLVEVDRITSFSRLFTHAGGAVPRTPDLRVHLYASILAQATNLGPVRMAELSDLSYRRLAWATNWYLREDTLKDAIAALVNFHHGLPLSALWGGGTLSSSDGQRFPVDVKARNAAALPRYFGYGRGVTFYSWTSEQFSQYGTKVVPSTVRDATYVLDGILGNETELPIAEHAVDTHGFTEVVFALFAALGLRFSPRIRDVSDQRLWRLDGAENADFFGTLLKGRIDEKLILRHWDDILRVAGSLKTGWVTSSLLVSRLQARPRKNALTKALQEYGRLEKTIFLLRYAESEDLRRRIGRQLNKGEELHALRRFLFFANEGHVRKRQPEEQTEQALCLNLLTDAVILWNTVRYGEILDGLRAEGYPLNDGDVARLSPTRYGHINPYGRYHFDLGPRPADASRDASRDASSYARGGSPGDDAQPRLPGTV